MRTTVLNTMREPVGLSPKLNWLIRLGMLRAVFVVTAFSVLLSLIVTSLHLHVFSLVPVPYDQWVYTAIAVPAIVAPLVTTIVLQLAFQLIDVQKQLAALAHSDQLTGVGNRRFFMDFAERELARVSRGGKAFSVLVLDIDHFKVVNDKFGHASGDAALVLVAAACNGLVRRTDVFCRWGGEEFIALLPETNLQDAVIVAEKLRSVVSTVTVREDHCLTASIGVATWSPGFRSIDELIQEADRQLYEAKSEGRNRTFPRLQSCCVTNNIDVL